MNKLDLDAIKERLEHIPAPLGDIQFYHHVKMRQDIKALLTEVERLRTLVDKLETHIDALEATGRALVA